MSETSRISRRHFVASAVCATMAALPTGRLRGSTMQKMKGDGMMTLTPYLFFEGTCSQAMAFYQSCFGGDLTLTRVEDSPMKDHLPVAQQHKVINARLKSGNLDLFASDWLRGDRTSLRGNTVCLYLSGGSLHDLKSQFVRLSEGAEVTDPLKVQFFGAYGALNDKFGVR